ncbi:cytochrome c oxidase subunit 4 [Leucobacter sp. cx-328]|uniref:cytochrome c oxidase subunit 4 n=1 Tax=unclassified Leucobacter TaxID=2621730 RepID=UPI00165D648B|nr:MULTISPECIES: cytochrome c oxidase subunit 4 [unclassified Leucobacter]MBC9943941.1 cytochrome c oxidase subunit 4 [Leucobacter sp. cx-328]
MKSNIVIFWILAIYFALLATVYTAWNFIVHGYLEWSGSMSIFGAAFLAGMIAVYLGLVQKKQGGLAIEDRLDSDIDDGDPELGDFSPWSWWPFMLALACALVVLGMCLSFNFWISFFSVPLLIVSVVGWVYEYYRGNFAR